MKELHNLKREIDNVTDSSKDNTTMLQDGKKLLEEAYEIIRQIEERSVTFKDRVEKSFPEGSPFVDRILDDKTEEVLFEKNKFDIISQAEESEKKKIARELHDGIGQNMVLLNLLFQNMNVPENEKDNHKEVGKIIQNCIKEIKEIAYNLLPPELERGFLNAVNRFANRINATGRLEFFIEIEKDVVEEDITHVDKFISVLPYLDADFYNCSCCLCRDKWEFSGSKNERVAGPYSEFFSDFIVIVYYTI